MKDYRVLDELLGQESRLLDVLNQRAIKLHAAQVEECKARHEWIDAHENVEKEMRIHRKGGN